MTELQARLRLIRTESVGPQTYRRLMERFATASAALEALPSLARQGGRSAPLAIPTISAIERELADVARAGARLMMLGDADYPPYLAQLHDAPAVLALKGDAALLKSRAIAVVGARNASANGRRIAEDLAAGLAKAGIVVVSGLARGIDTEAHQGAMRTGRTIAAIAGGIDMIYPPENAALQEQIGRAHLLMAEAPIGTAPLARHFPKRNRIIAGLVSGIVVVEAAVKSGTMLTARLGVEAGREIFAVPGSPLDERCRGCNDLIRQGAHLTETIADIFTNLPDQPGKSMAFSVIQGGGLAEPVSAWQDAQADQAGLTRARRVITSLLGPTALPVDEIARHCQCSAAILATVLMELEIAGRITFLPGNRVALLS